MAFSDSVKDQAFARSGGRCECTRQDGLHNGRCTRRVTRHGAEYHHVHASDRGGHDGLSNCQVLCQPCHKATPSYGRH